MGPSVQPFAPFLQLQKPVSSVPQAWGGVSSRGLPLQTLKYCTRGYSLTSQQDGP